MTDEPSRDSLFSELFIVDARAGSIVPSLPFVEKGLVKLHAAKFFVPGVSGHYEAFKTLADNEDKILPYFKAVGKVLIITNDGVKTGSAFFVSPTVLCTAGHVGYANYPKLFTTARLASSVEQIKLEGGALIVNELGKDWVYAEKATEKLAVRLDRDPVCDHDPADGSIAQCDFAFLQVVDYQSTVFLYPDFNNDAKAIAAIGYPGGYPESSLQKSSLKHLHLSHSSILAAFGNETGTKHIAPGKFLQDNGRILAHNASTLKGSSGSPIVDPTNMHFVGIHIEGWDDVEWNLSVSTRHPVFQRAYRQFVYPTLPNDAQLIFNAINP